MCAADPAIVVLPEPVEDWRKSGLLRRMYDGSMSKLEFQTIALATIVGPRLGTALHHYIECELNGTPIPPPADLETEIAQWHCWRQSAVMREYGLMPYRTELTVAARANGTVVCAGQIDALFIDKHGFCYMEWWTTSRRREL